MATQYDKLEQAAKASQVRLILCLLQIDTVCDQVSPSTAPAGKGHARKGLSENTGWTAEEGL